MHMILFSMAVIQTSDFSIIGECISVEPVEVFLVKHGNEKKLNYDIVSICKY